MLTKHSFKNLNKQCCPQNVNHIPWGKISYFSDWIITKEEFVNMETGWPAFYGDSQETAEQFFDNLDVVCIRMIRRSPVSGCGYLGPMDLIQHYRNMEDHGSLNSNMTVLRRRDIFYIYIFPPFLQQRPNLLLNCSSVHPAFSTCVQSLTGRKVFSIRVDPS